MLSKYLTFMGVMLSIYDTKQINCFKCGNYDHLLPRGDDLLPIPVKRSHEKKVRKENVLLRALKEVNTL